MNLTKNNLTKYRYGKLLSLLFLMFATMTTYGQAQSVSGTVYDNSGSPLPGVNVIVKGTSSGTQTDFDGNYTINNVDSGAVLEFSYIGFKTTEATFSGSSVINVTMEEDTQALDEVVVIGYGTQKKSDVTGAVASIDSKAIEKFTFTDASQALQGQLAGVSVQSAGGAPGAGTDIVIRGIGTFSNNGPLFVIDGVITNNMSSVSPQDIANVSVLKDASALAIYGSRAANGVVIVTTKKGTRGKLSIDFNTSYGVASVIRELDWANNRQYADIVNRANDNDGNARFPANDTQFDPNFGSNLYAESVQTAGVHDSNLRLSGGGENTLFSLSLSHYDQEGVIKFSDFERYTVRANAGFTKGRFDLQSTIGLTRTVNNPNPYFNRERNLLPTINLRNSAGQFSASDLEDRGIDAALGAFYGPGTIVNELGLAALEDRTITRNTILGNIAASYEIFNGLTYKLSLGLESYANNNFRFSPAEQVIFDGSNRAFSELSETNENFLSTLVEHTLNYNRTFGKHTVDVLGGFTEQINDVRRLGVNAINFPSNDIRVASAGEVQNTPAFQGTDAIQSYFGRVNYTFDDRYVLTGTLRRDGSSLFKEELRWGTFPSAAVAWNISNEPFLQDFDALTNIKFRVGYGEIGSNNVGRYATDPVLNLFSEYILGDNQTRVQGYSITNSVNPNLTWETTKTTNYGLEFNTLNNRLGITMEYFVKDTEDILVSTPLSFITGTGNPVPANRGSITNSGFEFLANYRDQITDDLSVSATFNFSTVKNEVTSIGDGSPIRSGSFTSNTIFSTRTDVGQPIGSFYGYIVDGIYQSDAEATAANDQPGNPRAGDLRFKDIAGPDGSGPDGIIDENDETYIGNPAPDFEYGLNLSAEYKNWDVSLFFNGVAGNEILNGTKYRGYFDFNGNYFADALNAWTPSNTNTNIPRNTQSDPGFNRRMSTFYLEDGSYFRLRNAQVGYSIPDTILDKIKLAKLRLYVSAINLFTITDYEGYYPEVGRNGRGGRGVFTRGVDEGSYPTPRTLQLGVQVSF
ncbi:SusC/RagA family TonB-linked outer membrane protein [Croceitalea marina]|uniref:SusC/RagA family TonB-linked outer membrane protein n=1 Tax=Croceitalea marina TaxID=1775166 RepID=A0ABW5N060_9FLAO